MEPHDRHSNPAVRFSVGHMSGTLYFDAVGKVTFQIDPNPPRLLERLARFVRRIVLCPAPTLPNTVWFAMWLLLPIAAASAVAWTIIRINH